MIRSSGDVQKFIFPFHSLFVVPSVVVTGEGKQPFLNLSAFFGSFRFVFLFFSFLFFFHSKTERRAILPSVDRKRKEKKREAEQTKGGISD